MTWKVKAGLAAALILALIQFVYMPFDEWRLGQLDQLESLIRNIQKKKALVGQEQNLTDTLKDLSLSLQQVTRNYYLDVSDAQALQLSLQKDIEKIAITQRVKINRAEWMYAVESDVLQAPIKVTCEGTAADILRFIHALESAEPFIVVSSLKLMMAGKTDWIGLIMEVSTFGLKKNPLPS